MIYGYDFLGAAMFPQVARQEFPERWALGIFAREFGDALPVVKDIIAAKRPSVVRVQLVWSRDNHTYTDKHLAIAKREAARYQRLALAFPNTPIELSTFCEHNLTRPDPYHDQIAKIAPNCTVVNSPWNGALSKKYKNEVHGAAKAPAGGGHNYSFDGTGCVDVDMPAFLKAHRNASVFYLWTYQFNGKRNGSTLDDDGKPLLYIPPTERKYWPSERLLDGVRYLINPKGEPSLAQSVVYKAFSDQINEIPTGRELKPVIIAPQKALSIEFVTTRGEIVATAPYYGPFHDGRHRYYAPQMGHEIAERAIRKHGSPIVRLRVGRTWLGSVNPSQRQNDYRNK